MHAARSIRSTGRAVALALLLPVLGCGDPLSPADVSGTYVLQRVADRPLPTELFRNADVVVRVFADTIRLRADGTASIASVTEVESIFDGSIFPSSPEEEGRFYFRVVGGRIEITYICPPNASCVDGPQLFARRDGDGLLVETWSSLVPPRFYTRVASAR
jgi:hypothetical protein